jgi:tubulin polyglutamylase TTLL9
MITVSFQSNQIKIMSTVPFVYFDETTFQFSHIFLNSILDVHLTNVAIQKTAPDYDPEKGCKWSMPQLRQFLTAKHGLDSVSILV